MVFQQQSRSYGSPGSAFRDVWAQPGDKGPGPGPGGAPAAPGIVPSHLQDNPYAAEQRIAEELYKAGRGPNPYPEREPEVDPLGRMRLEVAQLRQQRQQQLASMRAGLDAEYQAALARVQLVAPQPRGAPQYA